MRGVTLNRLHDVGNQVVALLELHIDAAPRLSDLVAELNESIVRERQPEADEHKRHNRKEYGNHSVTSRRGKDCT